MAPFRDSRNRAVWLEGLGRVRTRPVVMIKRGVARAYDDDGGQPFDPATGIVLDSEEAYETVRIPVREEPLGSMIRTRENDRLVPF